MYIYTARRGLDSSVQFYPFPFLALCLLVSRLLYFVVLFPRRRRAVAKLDETRYRIERAITASSRVGARLLTRLYVAETLNCTTQRELASAKTVSSNEVHHGEGGGGVGGKERRKITDKATRIIKKNTLFSPRHLARVIDFFNN